MEQNDNNRRNEGAAPDVEAADAVAEEKTRVAPETEKEDNALPEEQSGETAPREPEDNALPEKQEGGSVPPADAEPVSEKKKTGGTPSGKKPAPPVKKKKRTTGTAGTGGAPARKKRPPAQGPRQPGKTGAKQGGASGRQKNPAGSYAKSPSDASSRSEKVRRSAADRKKKKRRRDAFIVFLMVLMMAAILVVLSTTLFFKAGKIVVNNQSERYSEEQIAAASGLKPGDNMFTADLKKAEDAVERELPYIRIATVRRKWPETFFIDAEYAEMILAVRKGNAFVYIDVDGKVLETDVSVPDDDCAVVTGVYAEEAVPGEQIRLIDGQSPDTLVGIARGLYEGGIRNVTGINIENPTDVLVELDHRIEVKFGAVSSFADRIEFGRIVIEKNLKEGSDRKLIIDLTTEAKAFVRIKQDPSKPPATATDAETVTPTDAEEDYDEGSYDYDEEETDEDYDEDYDGDYDGDYYEEEYDEADYEDYGEYDYADEDYVG